MSGNDQPDHYGVIGNPISHSLSPRIHAQFAEQTGQNLDYRTIELPIDGFEVGIRDLQQQGFSGVNVTVPFKLEAWALCDRRSTGAELAGAVNTLKFLPDASIVGDNTDGIGLKRDLTNNLGLALEAKKILLLGAGGAARGVMQPLLALSPQRLTIANRTVTRAVDLARDFAHLGQVDAIAYSDLGGETYDLIVNGTAAGLSDEVPPVPASVIGADTTCYDMMYKIDAATAFVAWARDHNAALATDGLGMLVEQAAAAFVIWRGVEPDSGAVIASLRQG